MKIKREPYTCPRCGYTVARKDCMRQHLYTLKKTCQAIKADIELTVDVKECILLNRKYHIAIVKGSDSQNIVNNTINNYHHINNFISGMDVIEKLTKYMEYKKIELCDFEDRVDDTYHRKVKKLENDSFKVQFQLKLTDLFEIVDAVSKLCNGLEDFNIMYDEKLNKLRIFSYGEWRSLLLDSGIKEMVETIQKCYLDTYECYLIRKMKQDSISLFNKNVMYEHLMEYYKFLSCFDVTPFVDNKNDYQILYNFDDEKHHTQVDPSDYNKFSIQDEYKSLYISLKNKNTSTDVNKTRRDVKDIVKRNTKSNIIELNKKMVELFQMDEQFKSMLISNISCQMSGA